MKVTLECLPCIVDDVITAAALVTKNKDEREQITREVGRFLSEHYRDQREPSYYITEVHRILKRVSGVEVPFSERRHASNVVGKKVAENLVLPEDERERFSYLVRAAVAANHIDYRTVGTGYEESSAHTEKTLLEQIGKGLDRDESGRIYEKVRHARSVLYICDNVGEIAIDRLLVAEIQKYTKVRAAVRGGAITSDATLADALFVGLDRTCPLIVAGPDTLGISFDEMSHELRDALNQADLVITKGQANFYVMDEHKNEVSASIACLFSTKCNCVSSLFGMTGKVNLAVVLKD